MYRPQHYCTDLPCTNSSATDVTAAVLFLEAVVAESVVVIKKLLQMNPSQHCDIIKHMARLIDHIQVVYV